MRNTRYRRPVTAGFTAVMITAIWCALAAAPAAADLSHVFLTTFGGAATTPKDPYPLLKPTDVAIDNSNGPSAGDIYVADPQGHRIEKFTEAGQFILMFGLEVNKTAVEESATRSAEENVCPASGHPDDVCQPGTKGISPGAYDGAIEFGERNTERLFLAVDPTTGDVYVADPALHGSVKGATVTKVDEEGRLITSWQAGGQLPRPEIGPGNYLNVSGVAVNAIGDAFIAYNSVESPVDEYSPAGVLLNQYVTGRFVLPEIGVGIDSDNYLYSGTGKWNEAGLLSSSPVTVPAEGLAIDPPTNDPYVVQPEEGGFVSHFLSTCTEECKALDEFGRGQLSSPRGIAISGKTGDAFVANAGAGTVAVFNDVRPLVTTEPAAGVTDTRATFSGHVDPFDRGNVVSCHFEYGQTNTYRGGGTLPCVPAASNADPITGPTDVTADVSGLRPGTLYHVRLVAENVSGGVGHGTDKPFETFEKPTIDGFFASHVLAHSADLTAVINPNRSDTTYNFEYGTTPEYGQSIPEVPKEIGSAGQDQTETVHLEGLDPDSTYHFRVVAKNAFGTTTTYDQTFGFFPPQCPNALVRQQTGSEALPDCRAYELVSPANAGSALIMPAGGTPSYGYATSPSRVAFGGFAGILPVGGHPENAIGDQYVATRTASGWVTRYVGPPGNQVLAAGAAPWDVIPYAYGPDNFNFSTFADESLSTVVDWNDGCLGAEGPPPPPAWAHCSNAPYVNDVSTGEVTGRLPTNLASVEHGEDFEGVAVATPDLTHFVFSSEDLVFSRFGKPHSVYDNNTVTGKINVVSLKANGEYLDQKPVYIPYNGTYTHPSAIPLKVSADGSHILLASGVNPCTGYNWNAPMCGEGALLMRVDDAVTHEIAVGHQVHFVGMTADGTEVYFTSPEQLTSDDEDQSVDLYRWSQQREENGEPPLTLVSKGNPGSPDNAGNADQCHAVEGWAARCNIAAISFTNYSVGSHGGDGGNGLTDSYLASANGDIYFYSPEQLAGPDGTPGDVNLYLFHAQQETIQYVATLRGPFYYNAGPVDRMDISPDDSHMAFITASRVTKYANVGHTEMYTFTPSTGEVLCVSCRPNGEPPTGEVLGAQNGLFMANDGHTFFSTPDALVPRDTDNTVDVYEFTDGRPQLISTGTTDVRDNGTGSSFWSRPGLVAVSADGTDAYFATHDVLVRGDENGEAIKIYDARVNGGFPSPEPVPGCAAAEECHGTSSTAPVLPVAGTGSSLGGGGNLHKVANARGKKHRRHARRHRHRHRHATPRAAGRLR